MAIETGPQLGPAGACGGRLRDHNDVDRGQGALAERFPDQSFEAITHDGTLVGFLGNSEPEARLMLVSRPAEHRKKRVATANGFFENVLELARCQQTLPPGETAVGY